MFQKMKLQLNQIKQKQWIIILLAAIVLLGSFDIYYYIEHVKPKLEIQTNLLTNNGKYDNSIKEEFNVNINESEVSNNVQTLVTKVERHVKGITTKESTKVELKIPNYNIPTLTKEQQDYIYTYSQKENISYELILAIFYLETGQTMKPDYITNNVAFGLGQWHKPSGTFDTLQNKTAEILHINVEDVQWDNPIHNATGTIWYLKGFYNRLDGYSEEIKTDRIILAYRLGFDGMKDYVKHQPAINHPYVKRVLEYKYMIERGELFGD